ncbi:hypothetical protein GJU39_16925 [Pedobacter petrophilus]|uniref:Uncharacterized protein n=2 Tax=Pedobacter TaxID=84567 RepID=A0A7K0G2Z2_9SPHI|nr:hypothetical protein [Pedobacter petrophilus]MRX77770.1 hypothetical protein [Pedobacter petrophilus]
MEAMEYEYLMRSVYQCGRGGAPGADADYYRKMEHAERAYKLDVENIKNRVMRISTKPIEDLKYEYEIECNSIWLYVSKAISKATETFRHKFSDAEISELRSLTKRPTKLNKETIDKTIDIASEVFIKHEIQPQ